MPDLRAELVAILVALSGYPITLVIGYQLGYRAAPRRPVDFSTFVFRQTAVTPAPVELVRTEPRGYTRLSWRMLSRSQWTALWHSTATAELAGDGKPFSRAELEQVRDMMIRRGVASWKNDLAHSQGWMIRKEMLNAIAGYVGAVVRRGEI